jgi:hypothetical protein
VRGSQCPITDRCPPAAPATRSLPIVEFDRREISHLVHGQVEQDAGIDSGHRADRDGDLLESPQVALIEQHVGHVAS